MKVIPLTKGMFSLVDDEDFESLSMHKWQIHTGNSGPYASRRESCKKNKKRPHIFMSSAVIGKSSCLVIDHINGNTLDNRRTNLRFCTHSQNLRNSKPSIDTGKKSYSRYKGVKKLKRKNRFSWIATIYWEGDTVYLGSFKTEEEAARRRDIETRKLHGEYSWCNFPVMGDSNYGNKF